MSILDAIANPQMADIAGALDIRQKRLDADEAKRKEIRMGQLIAQALPNINAESPLYELATNSPREFAVFAKALGIPLNAGDQMQEMANDVGMLYTVAQDSPEAAFQQALNMQAERKQQGRATPQLDKWIDGVREDPQRGMTALFLMHRSINGQNQNKPAGLIEFESMTAGLGEEDKEKARRVALGLDPRAVGSADITTATTGLTDAVAQSEGVIEGEKARSKKTAELDVQLEKLPLVKSAVLDAESKIRELADKRTVGNQNAIVFNMYDTAMEGLKSGLSGTETGPLIGRAPALTSNQQIADGAVAAMAPLLKSMFRTAGEGTFTDKDQEMLIKMVPTRTDTPEARESKIKNIDAIIKAKLEPVKRTVKRESTDNSSQPSIEELLSKY